MFTTDNVSDREFNPLTVDIVRRNVEFILAKWYYTLSTLGKNYWPNSKSL